MCASEFQMGNVDSPAEEAPAEAAPVQEEVPQEPAVAEPEPASPPPRGGGGRMSKKFIVLIVVGIIVLSVVGYLYRTSEVSSLSFMDPELEQDHISIQIRASSSGARDASGDVDLTIKYDDDGSWKNVYNGKISLSSNQGTINLGYEEFVIANGDYQLEIEAGSASATHKIRISKVLETVDFSTATYIPNVPTSTDPNKGDSMVYTGDDITLTGYFFFDTAKGKLSDEYVFPASLTIELKNGGTLVDTYTNDDFRNSSLEWETTEYDTYGNYSIEVTLENSLVKSTSDYDEVTETFYTDLNVLPVPDAGEDYTDSCLLGDQTVSFDGTNSWNDGTITYQWDFDIQDDEDGDGDPANDDQSNEATPSYTYDCGQEYTAALYIIGDYVGGSDEVNFDLVEIDLR